MRVLKEGTRLADRYTLIRRLGGGAMSRVWLAHDSRTDARVALKFPASDPPVDEAGRELLQREWRIGSRLMHPNIARVFEFHDDPDGPFYAQQYLPGPTAGVLVGEPWKEALRPFGMIADALRYAHGKGMVHRDVKAQNVLFDHRGLPYLIDFGVASAPGVQVSGGGTPVAASPQQEAGEPPAPADDIHALGVLLHETITGRPPERDGESGARLPMPATAEGAAVPDAVRELVNDMLAAQANRRPSASELAERLREAGIEPGPAPPRVLGRQQSPDTFVPVETVSPTRRSTVAPAAGPDAGHPGVPPAALWGGLSLLLAAFLGVIFWLPGAVDRNGTRDGGTTAEPEVPAATEAVDPEGTPTDTPATSDPAVKAATDETLGELLSKLERLKMRGIERWGGQSYLEAIDLYEQGDRAFLARDYRLAGERYRGAIEKLEPFFGRIDREFRETLRAAEQAFARGDHAEAVRLYDLAVAITPSHDGAQAGLERARNLERVLTLTEQALRLERDLELQAARTALEEALTLDPAWQPAQVALARIKDAIVQRSFEQRMTEGLEALSAGNYPTARAAFNAARDLRPGAQQPVDGLLQVDQEVRLASIRRMESEAGILEEREQWQDAIAKYEQILEIDGDLQFARQGLANARERAAIHERLQEFIGAPDSLSAPATMQAATQLLLRVSRISPTGPRLEDQKEDLSRLLKRAATPLTVQLVSDNATEVSIYRVGTLGTFARQELTLRPGEYVALGSRPGFRDVRLEFRVAPEIDMEPIVIMCEEQI
jgi:eukaryotic-like serine/threonine-protein kinase